MFKPFTFHLLPFTTDEIGCERYKPYKRYKLNKRIRFNVEDRT
jgi:hypothetical protein